MDANIILGRILQKLIDTQYAKYEEYNRFEYVKHTNKAIEVTREKGENTSLPFAKILKAIEGYQNDPHLYDQGPTALRTLGLTHITSPIFSLLHLLQRDVYVEP